MAPFPFPFAKLRANQVFKLCDHPKTTLVCVFYCRTFLNRSSFLRNLELRLYLFLENKHTLNVVTLRDVRYHVMSVTHFIGEGAISSFACIPNHAAHYCEFDHFNRLVPSNGTTRVLGED